MQEAAQILDEYKIKHEDQIVSAHRTPARFIRQDREVDAVGRDRSVQERTDNLVVAAGKRQWDVLGHHFT